MICQPERSDLTGLVMCGKDQIRTFKDGLNRHVDPVIAVELLDGFRAAENLSETVLGRCNDPCLCAQQGTTKLRDERFWSRWFSLLMRRIAPQDVLGEFHQSILESTTGAEKRLLALTSVLNR